MKSTSVTICERYFSDSISLLAGGFVCFVCNLPLVNCLMSAILPHEVWTLVSGGEARDDPRGKTACTKTRVI